MDESWVKNNIAHNGEFALDHVPLNLRNLKVSSRCLSLAAPILRALSTGDFTLELEGLQSYTSTRGQVLP